MNESRTQQEISDDQSTAERHAVQESRPTNQPEKLTTADLAGIGTSSRDPKTNEMEHLLPSDKLSGYRERWTTIQTTFVDEPKTSVQEADSLVAEVIQQLSRTFAEERGSLEQQWSGGGEASTEDLRQALRHYRTFFERLLAA